MPVSLSAIISENFRVSPRRDQRHKRRRSPSFSPSPSYTPSPISSPREGRRPSHAVGRRAKKEPSEISSADFSHSPSGSRSSSPALLSPVVKEYQISSSSISRSASPESDEEATGRKRTYLPSPRQKTTERERPEKQTTKVKEVKR